MKKIQLLDCTLRDGAYIVNGDFGKTNIGGIIRKLIDANVDIIECGWLKNTPHNLNSTYYHVPGDIEKYIENRGNSKLIAMIDYNRYDCSILPECKNSIIDAIRVVFPKDKVDEGIEVASIIKDKGYGVYLQAANTPGYSDADILQLVEKVNVFRPIGISIVDTFGVMYSSDLERIITIMDHNLSEGISLGFHSHNNKQLSFSLVLDFIDYCLRKTERSIIVDSSLCGMGRGAGNACTELVSNYLNEYYHCNYGLDEVMDCIDLYMKDYQAYYQWGYSVQYALAGIYGCHVNNVSYLMDTHRVRNKEMRIIFDALPEEKRIQYDYDNLENVYMQCHGNEVDDSESIDILRSELKDSEVLLVLPGKTSHTDKQKIKSYIYKNNPVVIGVNSALDEYEYDWLFYNNAMKYEYNKDTCGDNFCNTKKIITSNLLNAGIEEKYVINYNSLQKGAWKYRDNSLIMILRLLADLSVRNISISGFDGYVGEAAQYANGALKPCFSSENETNLIQSEIEDMFRDYIKTYGSKVTISFLTKSPFEKILESV